MSTPRITGLVIVLLTSVVTFGSAGPAAAHGDNIRFEISGGPHGHLRVVATWENDGDPVDEPVAGTLSATAADGRSAGPWRLIAVPGSPAAYSTEQTLPAGRWSVTVESGFPALGRGQAQLTVDDAGSVSPIASAASSKSDTTLRVISGLIGAAVIAAGALTLRARRQARRRISG